LRVAMESMEGKWLTFIGTKRRLLKYWWAYSMTQIMPRLLLLQLHCN
jgi:hypothetical protein